jgi:TPR repeat protein
MTALPRDKKLFWDFCANMNPGPLTDAERREYQVHFEYFLSLAREGDAARQHDVGVKYLEGFWVEADHKQAAYWFTQAANNGDVDAQEALAGLYCLGIGVERNPVKATQWMSLAAEGGSPSAQFDLARMFQAGAGVPKDFQKAAFWFHRVVLNEKAPGLEKKSIFKRIGEADSVVPENKITNSKVLAEAQYAQAGLNIAVSYYCGDRVERDLQIALQWATWAGKNGHLDACVLAGNILREGINGGRDLNQARHWYLKSAYSGDPRGQHSMGLVCWDQSKATEDDRQKAAYLFESYYWYRLAAENGSAPAKEALRDYEKNFTDKLLAEAQRLEPGFREIFALESKEGGNQTSQETVPAGLIGSSLPTASPRTRGDEFADRYNRGWAAHQKGDNQAAVSYMTSAIEINPKYPDAYNERGLTYDALGQFDRAIADYNRGKSYQVAGDLNQAIVDYSSSIRLEPSSDAYGNRGDAFDKAGDVDAAIRDYTEAIRLNPNDAVAYYNRAKAYAVKKGDFDHAISDYTEAIRCNPRGPDAFYNRGITYARLGDFRKALNDFSEAIELNPNNGPAYYNRGVCYSKLGMRAQAETDISKAKSLGVPSQ